MGLFKLKIDNLVTRITNFKIVPSPYWTAEIYGFGRQLSNYGFYPYCLPLCVFTDHGPGYVDHIALHEIESTAPVQLYHSPVSVNVWLKETNKKAFCMLSPNVFFRRKHKISKSERANGTLVFPAHSTPSIDDLSGYVDYIGSLKCLPEKYHPLTVCLHMHDINKGLDEIFISNGFTVVTVGDTIDQRFIERFYALLRNYRFTTSNIPGSYMYYSVEMEIPFFIYGNKPLWFNNLDPNINAGAYNPFEIGYGKKAYDLFLFNDYIDKYPIISKEQANFAAEHLGLNGGISRLKMAKILYSSLVKWALSKAGFVYILKQNVLTRVVTKFIRFIARFIHFLIHKKLKSIA